MDLSVIPQRQGSKWTRDKVAECVYLYITLGNCDRVARAAGVPSRTVHDWRNTEWWDKAVAEVRNAKQDELDAASGQLIDKAMHYTADRMEHGDYKLDKHGQLHRVPMTGRDLTWCGAVWFDKQRILRGLATSISGNGEGLAARLLELERKADAKVIDDKG